MTDTLESIRQLLSAQGFDIADTLADAPAGGLIARRDAMSVVVYVADGKYIPGKVTTQRFQVAPESIRPRRSDMSATPEVAGLRARLVVEK